MEQLLTIKEAAAAHCIHPETLKRWMPFDYNGLAFHPCYEGKCWNYIKDHLAAFRPNLDEKTLFWIVGSEPKIR